MCSSDLIDVLGLKGSYAGAIGIPQFMPRSYRLYAVDFDGDGRKDLSGSPVDAVGSVANFLKEHGWQRSQPVAIEARTNGDRYRSLLAAGIKPVYRGADLASFDVAVDEKIDPDAGVVLIELESPGQASGFWVGLDNFYVLTRYNRSTFYAIAVIELAREIARALPAAAGTNNAR